MVRERWFYAEGHRRMGPVPRRELVEALLQLTDPRACLVWRRGLETWMPAADVPEIEKMLAPFARAAEAAPAAPAARPAVLEKTGPRRIPGSSHRPAPPPERPRSATPLYAAGGAGVLLLVVALVWFLRPRPASDPTPVAGSSVSPEATSTPAAGSNTSAASTGTNPAGAGSGFLGWADQEGDLPPAELRRLRGVGGWAGEKLTVTLYNGSSWRITEIYVLTSRMEGDRFVDSPAAHLLLPVGGAPVDGAVQDLLQKVAPDRKRAGVNPADTGPFEVVLGPQPAAYRWKIERARGYPPRTGP